MLNDQEKEQCLQIAKDAIAKKLNLKPQTSNLEPHTSYLKQSYGLFISLYINQNLRGCIGYIKPFKPLYESLIELAQLAAFSDERFHPLSAVEFDKIDIEISILSPLYEISDKDDFEIGRDGLFITNPKGKGLLLPQVATKYNWTKETFLKETCKKAGLKESALQDEGTTIYRFEAIIFQSKNDSPPL